MTAAHKPDDYTAVAPYLVVTNAPATIAFLTEVFGARELRRSPYGAVLAALAGL